MNMKEEIEKAFNKFVHDRVEKDIVDAIVKLEFWKSNEIATKRSEANETLNQLVEFAIREPDMTMKIFAAIAEKVEGEQRRKLVEALFTETRLWHISYHAKARPLDKGRRHITQFLGDLYNHSLISIGEIRASMDELLEYRKESFNASTGAACVLLERVGKKFALEERAQYSVKEVYEGHSAYAALEKAKFGCDGDVRNEIDTQLKYQWMYLKDYQES